MTKTDITQIFMLVITTFIIIYDVIALKFLGGEPATISAHVWDWSKRYPMVPFAMGIVCGHLFWQAQV